MRVKFSSIYKSWHVYAILGFCGLYECPHNLLLIGSSPYIEIDNNNCDPSTHNQSEVECMYVCMYIYMYVCMYVCIYVYMYVCSCLRICMCGWMHLFVTMCIVCIHVCT